MEALHTAWAFFIPVHNCVINIRVAEIVATVSPLSPLPENIKDRGSLKPLSLTAHEDAVMAFYT